MDRGIARAGRKVLLWTSALVMLFGQAGSVLAQTPSQAIFGPVSVKLPSSNTLTFSNSFSAPASVTGPYLLRVQLSAPNSLTSLSFRLNNVQVLALADFAGGKTLVDRTVTVQTNNTYSIQIAGKVNTVITVTVFATPNLPKPTSLTPNPLSVTVGASGTLTAALSPTPTAEGTLNVSSANTAVATVPASVSFASGQTSVAIPVTTHTVGNAVITASANGGQASATVNVTPVPPTVTSLAPATLTLTQGANGSLTVTISSVQTADVSIALASNASGIASVPFSILVPAGAVSAPVPVTAVAPGPARITASLNGTTATSQITVTPAPPTVVSLVPQVSSITRGASTALTLAISSVQSTDTIIAIAVTPPSGIVSAPAQVTVLAGQTTVPVPVTAVAFGQAGVSATLNGTSASALINVIAPAVAVTALEPATFTMNVGATSSFTVSINAAQPTGTVVSLAISDATILQIPASVTVAAGQTSAAFTATGLAAGNAVITASANNTSKTSSVHVSPQPAAIASLLPNPLPLQQGATGGLTVAINVAQETDTIVALASDAPAVAQVAASVTIVAGTISAPIPVTAVAPGAANVTASVNGISAATVVTVTPPPPVVTSLAPASLALPKGTPGTLRVAVSRAPSDPTVVALTSSAQAIASVPPTVNIPAGALFADFPVAANSEGQATITASLNGGSAISTVTITPAELVSLTLSPQTPTIHTGETQQFIATGIMTDGSSQDFTNRVSWTSADITVAIIDAGGLASTLMAGATNISVSFAFSTVIDGSTQTVSTSTTLTVQDPVELVLTAPTTTLVVGNSTTVTVTSSDPAPAGGLVVTLTQSGGGSATIPAAVSIAAGETSTTFTLTANTAGYVTITAAAYGRFPGSITFNIQPPLQIDAISPGSGLAGTVVTLTGTGFSPVPAENQIAFRGISNTTVPVTALSTTATQLTVTVPTLGYSGPITVTNARGTASSPPFTVTPFLTSSTVSVSVTSPTGGATISDNSVAVSGTFQGPAYTGITVNGVIAAQNGNRFYALVPLQPGANTLSTIATMLGGGSATQTVSVTSTGPAPTRVSASAFQGLPPLTVTFTIVSDRPIQALEGNLAVGFQICFEADNFCFEPGAFNISPDTEPLSRSFTYEKPGVYEARFNVIHTDGTMVTKTVSIFVQDVDRQLQQVWNTVILALARRETVQALQYFNAQAQAKYGPVFNALLPNLPQIVASFSAPQPMPSSGDIAEYVVGRTIGGVNQIFFIYFMRDADGIWRLDSM